MSARRARKKLFKRIGCFLIGCVVIVAVAVLREKARIPRAVHGDEWPQGVWGHVPPV